MGQANLASRVLSKVRLLSFASMVSALTRSVQVECKRCTCTQANLCENCSKLGISESSQILAYFAGNDSLTTMTVQQMHSLFDDRAKAFGKLPVIGSLLSVYLDGELVAVVNTSKQLGVSVGVVKRAFLHFSCFCYVSGSSLRGVTSEEAHEEGPYS